jgi:hypothetical protein
MRRLVVIVGLVLALVACSAPPGQGGTPASPSADQAAPSKSPAGRGDY